MCCSDYIACVFAAVWSIVQTLFHLGWCIWGTYLYECRYKLNNETFTYFWYLTYFYTNSCVDPTLDHILSLHERSTYFIISTNPQDPLITHINQTNQALDIYKHELEEVAQKNSSKIQFPPKSAVAERTYNIFEAFIIIDSLWIITAMGLLAGACFRIRGNFSLVFFFPWTIVLLLIIFFDGIAAGWYGLDISLTYGLTNWFIFIGGQNQTGLAELELKYPKASSQMPSILMMILFGRLFVVWIVNLLLFFRVVQAAVNAAEAFDDRGSVESKDSSQGSSEEVDVVSNPRPRDFQVREISPNSASTRIRRWQLYYGTDDEDEEREKEVRRYPRRYSKQKQQARSNEGWPKNNAFQYEGASGSGQNLAVIGGYEGDRSTSPSPLPDYGRKHIGNPYNSHYSSGYESNDMYLSHDECRRPSPSISSDYLKICDDQRFSQPYVGELRGQLPWSYFQDRNDVMVPKGRTYNDTMPPVPVPDYTLRFNNKDAKRVNVV